MVINNSWQLAPWADWLHACDFAWWEKYQGVPDFQGIKTTTDKNVRRRRWGVHPLLIDKGSDRLNLLETGVRIGWGGNSGFHCLNLAVQLRASKIILVGYDMNLDHGLHWHGRHIGLNNPTSGNVERWRRVIDGVAEVIEAMEIRVINAGLDSALTAYPKMKLREALQC